MFAGGDNKSQMSGTTKNYQSTQWSLNPSSYQNVENDQVDWAQLAQQWIQMKDTCPPEYDLGAPPPPTLCFQTNKFEEKGEADMEMDKDDEPFNSDSFNNFQSQQQQSSSWKSNFFFLVIFISDFIYFFLILKIPVGILGQIQI